MKLVLGIDTGGTYTDAVLLDTESGQILASGKAQTTKEDLSLGISAVMDCLPQELLPQVESLALSTTLATNACVEDKGGRAKLILIGAEKPVVEETGARYGLPPAKEIFFVDAAIQFDGTVTQEPDWEKFLEEIPPFLEGADSLAVVSFQGIRNPTLEQKAKQLLMEHFGLFTVCGHELFWSLNYIKRGASTLLNARLIPVITDFLKAIHQNMAERGMHAPIVIVRSDGTLMSEEFSLERPVETILCGPAASVMGGMTLSGARNCLVVDMGGTTTDIAIVRNGVPVKGDGGVSIGKWDTFVDSVYIHTIGLGGDSWIRLAKPGETSDGITAGPQRVIPLCAAAAKWPSIREELAALVEEMPENTHPLHEFFCLIRDISDDPLYSEQERAICRALKGGALRIDRLAAAAGADLYTLNTRRLETETIIMRISFTPTDAMHLRGDFERFDAEASRLAARFLANRLEISPEEFCERVFNRVKKELYFHIVQAMLENTDPIFRKGIEPGLQKIIEAGWDHRHQPNPLLHFFAKTEMTLVGIGASTHLFLADVADALGAPCIIPENAAVANALGAVTGRVSATVSAEIILAGATEDDGYHICTPRQRLFAPTYEEAVQTALEAVRTEARQEAERRGAKGEILITACETPLTARVGQEAVHAQDLFLSSRVTATASGSAGF
ncbi:MAG: hydantoinase/oxoprolinase family protein [Candidatus Merdivicinus sp.]|jgi:N-methylhydantoinase A/oxoprolinase/acetone carboxylase beta subunit